MKNVGVLATDGTVRGELMGVEYNGEAAAPRSSRDTAEYAPSLKPVKGSNSRRSLYFMGESLKRIYHWFLCRVRSEH